MKFAFLQRQEDTGPELVVLSDGVGDACLGERGVTRVEGLKLGYDVGERESFQRSGGIGGFLRGRGYVDMEVVMCGLVMHI